MKMFKVLSSTVGFGVEDEKIQFRCGSFKMKALFPESSGKWPVHDLNFDPERRLYNVYKEWENFLEMSIAYSNATI